MVRPRRSHTQESRSKNPLWSDEVKPPPRPAHRNWRSVRRANSPTPPAAKTESTKPLASKTDSVKSQTHRSGLTTQAQRPGPRGRSTATATRWPGSLQRMVRPRHRHKLKNLRQRCLLTQTDASCRLWLSRPNGRSRAPLELSSPSASKQPNHQNLSPAKPTP